MGLEVRLIIARLCTYWQVSSYKALAVKLGVGKSTPSAWITKQHIPLKECLDTVEKFGCSLDELILGIKRESVNDQTMISAIKEGLGAAYELELIPKPDAKSAQAVAILAVKAYKKKEGTDADGSTD